MNLRITIHSSRKVVRMTPHPTSFIKSSYHIRRQCLIYQLWRLWRHWRRLSAAVPLLPAYARSLSAAASLLPAAIAAWRQPTPVFPQPKAPNRRLPAVKRHNRAPSTPVPAANNGGSAAISKTFVIQPSRLNRR